MADFKTASMAIGEIIRASDHLGYIPMQGPISLVYASTAKDNPLRTLLRDYWIYESNANDAECLRAAGFPSQCVLDIAVEMLTITSNEDYDLDKCIEDIASGDMCHYHQHDQLHPKCVPMDSGMIVFHFPVIVHELTLRFRCRL